MKVIAPKPGVYKGIKFRSQLEIKWAKYFEKEGVKHLNYIDATNGDFSLYTGFPGGILEIKPKCPDLVSDHLWKWVMDPVTSECCNCGEKSVNAFSHHAQLMCGPPPSRYGCPVLLNAIFEREEVCVWVLASTFHGFSRDESVPSFCLPMLSHREWHIVQYGRFEELERFVRDYLTGGEKDPEADQ